MVRGETDDDNSINMIGTKASFEVSADETTVDSFVEHRLARERLCLRFNDQAGTSGIEETTRSGITVVNVNDW